jgi:16S rRNA (uracil1498-N3)-methyltransferase
MPRFFHPTPLQVDAQIDLSPSAARHVQVLRMQPGQALTLFDGFGGEYAALIQAMTRNSVSVQVNSHHPIEREAPRAVHLALGVPANERMDWLVEKATELGVASIQPLMTERGVLRLSGERADKKQIHWQAISKAACEQSGRNQLPTIHSVQTLNEWLNAKDSQFAHHHCLILSLATDQVEIVPQRSSHKTSTTVLSGAEGGFSITEETKAIAAGFCPISLGNRVLRAETAAIAALSALSFS